MKKIWTNEEIELLKEIYNKYPKKTVIELLSKKSPRTWDAIQKMASRLELKRHEMPFSFTKYDLEQILSDPEVFIPKIARKYEVSEKSVKRELKELIEKNKIEI